MRHLALISVIICSIFAAKAGSLSDGNVSDNERYSIAIEVRKACISGVCILHEDDEQIAGSVINEFGISAIDFVYDKAKGKVKLVNVIKFLNKWYIKRVLKNDLKLIVLKGEGCDKNHSYEVIDGVIHAKNLKYNLSYTLSPLQYTPANTEDDDETEE